MSFLAPLFLLGALAIAGPLVFHLIRRTTRDVTPFSSLMFLAPTPPRVTRRSRLENLWLLALRCLALALLALAFARPFLERSTISAADAAGVGRRIVVLIDKSGSMRRENLWGDARRHVDKTLRDSAPADEVAVLAFGRSTQTVVSFEEWNAMAPSERAVMAAQRLEAITPGWESTGLDSALVNAAELLENSARGTSTPGEIVVIGDLQEGSRLDALQGYEWPHGVQVVLAPVAVQHTGNASVHAVSAEETAAPADGSIRVRINVGAESARDQFQLRWEPGDAGAREVYAPAGQSRTVRMDKQPTNATALKLTGDEAEFDNTLYLLPPVRVDVPVLFLGQDAEDDPRGSLFYVRRAFPPTPRQRIEITAHRTPDAVPALQLQATQLLILGDRIGDAPLTSAREFARNGRIILVPLTSPESAANLAGLFAIPQLSAPEATVKNYGLLGEIDFQHPLFAAFADPRFSDFTKINFWKWRRLEPSALPGSKVLARFDNGDPAIVQAPLGRGSVVVFTSSWRTADSQLALSSKFVPLLHALLEVSSNLPAQQAEYFIGDTVPLPPDARTVRTPSGVETAVNGSTFTATDEPGIYAAEPGTMRFAVNLAPEESRTSPLPVERFTSLGVPLAKAAAPSGSKHGEEAHAQAATLENRQKLWRWLVAAALGVLLLETVIAGRLSRLARTPIVESA